MTSKRDPAAWQVITGTARGITHVARYLPNQDSVESRVLAPARGVVVAVADGHGAARHFRSSTGSLLAVRTACTVAAELAAEAGPTWTAEVAGGLRDQLPAVLVARWRELVARHLAAHPYAPSELSAMQAARDAPEIPYGSTLLLGLTVGDWLVCAQIGDGDLLAVAPDGRAWTPVASDDRLDGYHTTSLCQAGAVASFRTAAHDLRAEPLLALLLGTDGYGNAQASDSWQPEVGRDLAGLAAQHDPGWFRRQLPVWAERCASAQGSGDDTTIALLLAPDSVRLAAAAQPAAAPGIAPETPLPGIAPEATLPGIGPEAPLPGIGGELPAALVPAAPRRAGARSASPPGRAGAERTGAVGAGVWRRLSGRRAAVAAGAVVVAAGAVAAALIASQSPSPAQPGPRPASAAPAGPEPVRPISSTGDPAQKSTASPGIPAASTAAASTAAASTAAGSSTPARHTNGRPAGATAPRSPENGEG
ncbi:MAG TPA: protein phosphatase 2C domain-containing protein [Trebonia sp.]